MELKNFSNQFPDIKIIDFSSFNDARGEFLKIYESKKLNEHISKIDEFYFSTSKKNVIRGIHYQKHPHVLTKLVFCKSGEILDFFIDLRKDSSTYGEFGSMYLSEKNKQAILIPSGFGHGFASLKENTTILYLQEGIYNPEYEYGINPFSFDFQWGIDEPIVSKKDLELPNFSTNDERFVI